MADIEQDTGNTNVFTVWQGRYEIVPDARHCALDVTRVMLTCTNMVQFMGDAVLTDVASGTTFMAMPEECRPSEEVRVPVAYGDMVVLMVVSSDGSVSLMPSVGHELPSAGRVCLHGVNYNVSNRWY